MRIRGSDGYDPRITWPRVCSMDDWVCHLCGGPINSSSRVPDLNAGTVDHVVPVSLGGCHVWDNVRAAHFWCNSRRGDRAVDATEIRRFFAIVGPLF